VGVHLRDEPFHSVIRQHLHTRALRNIRGTQLSVADRLITESASPLHEAATKVWIE
jgi:hypothetical protein